MDGRDYSELDRIEISGRLFFPRRDRGRATGSGHDLAIPARDESLGARFHALGTESPTLLFFHGNGEIVADYDSLAPLFTGAGFNLLVVDFRGYGRSSGHPTASALIADAHDCLDFAAGWLARGGYRGSLCVMGRSLGSAPALELAARHGHPEVAGLAIESGFAHTMGLLETLGAQPRRLGLAEAHGFGNLEKIAAYGGPTLILHGSDDDLIPASEARALFEASPARHKHLVLIDGAGHNSLFAVGGAQYRQALRQLAADLGAP